MRDMKEKGTEQVVDFDLVIYVDDLYLDDYKSLKRKLLIAEELINILTAFILILLGFLTCYRASAAIHEFIDNLNVGQNIFIFVTYWLLSFACIVLFMFAFKNYSIYKGVVKSFLLNLVFAIGTYLTLACTSLNEGWIIASFASAGIYIAIMLITIIVVNAIDEMNFKSLMIIWPKKDTDAFNKKYSEKNSKEARLETFFMKLMGKLMKEFKKSRKC